MQNETVQLSVIIPGYNTPKEWWLRCLASVRIAAKDAEIICVDDGSTDGAPFLDELAGVKVVHQCNQGPSVARNKGLEIAKGEWIAFVDSDDEVNPDMFERCMGAAEEKQCDIALCGVEVVWPEDGLKKYDLPENRVYGELLPRDVKELADKCLLNYCWNKIYRRVFLERRGIRFPLDAVMGEDLIFNFDCIRAGAKWCSVDYAGYRYFRTHATLLSRYRPKLVSGLIHYSDVWKDYKKSVPGAVEVLGTCGECDERQIRSAEWYNMWMPQSPYSLLQRCQWLCNHPQLGGAMTFVKKMAYVFFRRWFYVRPIRRWNIKRLYPNATDIRSK